MLAHLAVDGILRLARSNTEFPSRALPPCSRSSCHQPPARPSRVRPRPGISGVRHTRRAACRRRRGGCGGGPGERTVATRFNVRCVVGIWLRQHGQQLVPERVRVSCHHNARVDSLYLRSIDRVVLIAASRLASLSFGTCVHACMGFACPLPSRVAAAPRCWCDPRRRTPFLALATVARLGASWCAVQVRVHHVRGRVQDGSKQGRGGIQGERDCCRLPKRVPQGTLLRLLLQHAREWQRQRQLGPGLQRCVPRARHMPAAPTRMFGTASEGCRSERCPCLAQRSAPAHARAHALRVPGPR